MSFRFLTAGESHGKALVGIIEGIPSQLPLTQEYLHQQLRRRKLGYGRGARQKIETDEVEILSGVRLGKTLGSPISLIIENRDWQAWQDVMSVEPSEGLAKSRSREVSVPRPGHADLLGGIKYDHKDMRNVLERSSARETAMRVGIGAIARRLLEELGIDLGSRVIQIGSVRDPSPLEVSVERLNVRADESPVRCTNPLVEESMMKEIERAKKEGDTLGGVVEIFASGVPVGLGSYVQWDRRLEGQIAQALMSLNAIKGVEVGLGFQIAGLFGSQAHDEISVGSQLGKVKYETNRAGGIDGGMSSGQTILVRAAMKPLSTLMKPLRSVDLGTGEAESAHVERSDVCAVPSAAVIGESLLGLVLVESILEKFGGDSIRELAERVKTWNELNPIE